MVRRVLMGLFWFLVFLGVCNLLCATFFMHVSFLFALAHGPYLRLILLVVCAAGTVSGILPGTKPNRDFAFRNGKTEICLRVLGALFSFYLVMMAFSISMGRFGKPPLSYKVNLILMLFLFLASAGMIMLKKWAWYAFVIGMPCLIATVIWDVGGNGIFQFFAFPLLIFVLYLFPKIRRRFN